MAIVVLAFLQSWRATLIPLIAVPVAIVGTFAVMLGMGFSLNNLSLFGLVLAIGIVVDDAIVVVEAVEHHLEHGLSPKEAARKAMDEVTGPIIAISLVLMCVFIPCAFIAGITGQFFRQFALTIAVSTFFSAVNSLTLSPALCGLLLKAKHEQRDPLTWLINLLLGWFFKLFNLGFKIAADVYSQSVRMLLRVSVIVLVVYGGLLYLTYFGFTQRADRLHSRRRTRAICSSMCGCPTRPRWSARRPSWPRSKRSPAASGKPATTSHAAGEHGASTAAGGGIPGIAHTITISGQSIVQNAIGSNYGTVYVVLDEFHHRHGSELGADAIAAKLRAACYREVQEARSPCSARRRSMAWAAPAASRSWSATWPRWASMRCRRRPTAWRPAATSSRGWSGLFSAFRAQTPQMYVDIDRERCKAMGVPLNEVFLTLQLYLGGYYTNDFNQFGRTWQVNLQGDPAVPPQPRAGAAAEGPQPRRARWCRWAASRSVSETGGPALVIRYNGVTAAAVNGGSLPGVSSGTVISTVEDVAERELPQGMNLQWTELTLLQIQAGNTAIIVFAVAVVLVFLVLAAQYESLTLPLAVILVVPMCLLVLGGRRGAGRHGHQHLRADRLRRARRPGQQERDPDRRIRQGEIGPRRVARRCHRRSLPPAPAADHHDLAGLHPGRRSAGPGRRRRRRDAQHARHRRVFRHARRDDLRHLPDARVLLRRRARLFGQPPAPQPVEPSKEPVRQPASSPAEHVAAATATAVQKA